MQSLNTQPLKLPSLEADSVSPVLPRPGNGKSDSVAGPGTRQERSRWLGRAVGRNRSTDDAHPLVDWLGPNLEQQKIQSRVSDSNPRFVRQLEALVSTFPANAFPLAGRESPTHFALSLATLLQWAWSHTHSWDASIREACLLKPLLPLYLSSALSVERRGSHAATGLVQTRQLGLELIAMVELGQSLEHVGFAEWLTHSARVESDLGRTLQHGLNVDLLLLTHALAEKTFGTLGANLPDGIHAPSVSELDHQRWWSFAWNWSRAQTAVLVPIGLPELTVSWSDLAHQWRSLHGLLQGMDRARTSRCMEIWDADDSQMNGRFEQCLDEVRMEKGAMTIVCVRLLGDTDTHPAATEELAWWQTAWLERIGPVTEGHQALGFLNPSNDLNLVFQSLNRNELTYLVREVLSTMQELFLSHRLLQEGEPVPMIVGIAAVESPAKSLRTSQLIDAAERCLVNAASQGPGTIKSIEVF